MPSFLSIVHVKNRFSGPCTAAFLLLMSVQKLGYWCQIVPIDPCLFLFWTKHQRHLCFYLLALSPQSGWHEMESPMTELISNFSNLITKDKHSHIRAGYNQMTVKLLWQWEWAAESSDCTFVTFSSFCGFDLTEQLLKELFFHAWQFCFVTILKFPVNRDIVICMNPFQESEVWCFIAGIVFYCIVLASVIIHLSKEIVNGMLPCCQS